eukprot:403336682
MSSIQNIEDPKQDAKSNQLSKRMIFSYLATFALGMVASQALFKTSQNQEFNEGKFLQKLWMSNQFQNFTWNTTRAIDYNQTGAGFTDLFVSPSGEIFGIQTAVIPEQRVSRAYRYNPNWDQWENEFYSFNTKKIRFDSEGNFYLIDQNNTLYAKNSQYEALLPCVQDVAPLANGTLFVIQDDNSSSCTLNSSDNNSTQIHLFPASYYKKVVLVQGKLFLLSINGRIQNDYVYLGNCASDISAGSDGTLWILDCSQNNTGNLQKYNNQTQRFEDNYNISAQRVEAYNEISVALLRDGRISYSLIENQNYNFTNTSYAYTY